MGRHRNRGARACGLPKQRDTPVKAALSRRPRCRRPVHNRYEAIPEEPEVEELNPVPVSSPAGHPAMQVTPRFEAFEVGKRPVRVTTQNLTVTLGSLTSSEEEEEEEEEKEEEEDEDEDDCYASSTSSSSLSSPEIFRRDGYETLTSFKEELLGLHLHAKNSTLLDVSHAESIRMHRSPNLSNIIDASPILAEKNCEIKINSGPKADPKIHVDPFKSEKGETPPKRLDRKPVSYKKKVCFKSPIQMELLHPKRSPGEASFFDFIDDAEREAFFRRMSERSEQLRNAPLFPLDALEYEDLSAM